MASITAQARSDSPFATGVLFIHSCPQALLSHVEWALASEINQVVKLDWESQPLMPQLMRATIEWRGPAGTASAVASALFGWQQLRFEVTEDRSSAAEGGRWMYTPLLGLFHLHTDSAGNGVLVEHAVRAAIVQASGSAEKLANALSRALGDAWDRELEPFRVAEEGDATIFELPRLGVG